MLARLAGKASVQNADLKEKNGDREDKRGLNTYSSKQQKKEEETRGGEEKSYRRL